MKKFVYMSMSSTDSVFIKTAFQCDDFSIAVKLEKFSGATVFSRYSLFPQDFTVKRLLRFSGAITLISLREA